MRHRFDFELRGYQHYSIQKCLEMPYLLLAIDMSLGKTVIVGTALKELIRQGKAKKVLVIGPKLVASDTWPTELREWRHLRSLTFSVIDGKTIPQRMRQLRADVDIHIINKEKLQWLWRTVGEKGWIWDTVVIDEASMLKEGKKRTHTGRKGKGSAPLSRFGILARATKDADTVIEMSGTPAPEGIHNMWGLMYMLDRGDRLGTSRDAFEKRWFDKGYMGWAMDPYPGAVKEIIKRSKDLIVSLRAEDHIELPPVITHPFTTVYVDLPKDVMREYKKFERELYSERYDVEAASSGVAKNKLLQFANGSMYRGKLDNADGKERKSVWVHDAKLDALEDMIEGLEGAHALIAWSFKFDQDAIRKRFGKKIKFFHEYGKNVIRDWNAGKIPYLALHPLNVSHGTNLQYGGHNLIHYGLVRSGETYRQLNMRLPRPGQPNSEVYIRHILASGTEDENVIESQEYKRADEDVMREATAVRKAHVDRFLLNG